MDYKEKLAELRSEIDSLDKGLIEMFQNRMQISDKIGDLKAKNNMSLTDEKREQQVIEAALTLVSDDNKSVTSSFMRSLFALSKIKQRMKLMPPGDMHDIHFPPAVEKKLANVTVAYQGVRGAWGEQGAMSMYPGAALSEFEYFEDVFTAVKTKQTHYGVVPIENSETGAIGEVYDLLRHHGCYIVGQTWVKVNQCLLSCADAQPSDIREILSHPQGFAQCRRFLKNKNWELTTCRNTAVAAQTVADKNDKRFAAIGSRQAADVYGLKVLVPDIMDNTDNRTRFIAISDQPVYDESCDTVSVTFSTLNRSGALCAVLQSFMLAGINLTRIESRPGSGDKYRFFADLQANILNGKIKDSLKESAAQCEYFEILGCYKAN